jgi:predicted Zn-dependent peptidase
MRQQIVRSLMAAAILLAGMTAATAQDAAQDFAQVPIQEFTLDNGLKVLMVERHDSPVVAAGWIAHVGSVNESYGITGIAHLFEHMMFKGTRVIGTTDIDAELEIMAKLDAVRAEMTKEYSLLREAKRRGEVEGSIYLPENRTDRLEELATEMEALQDAQREYIVKDELDQVYTEAGASGMNAGTSNDFTVYFITVPSNKLELWFWMESNRLFEPVFREFYSEREVVREERRLRVESDPTAKFEEQFDAMFWQASPYHHPVIGWPSDVESISRAQANEFFATYYAPNNLTAALVGDFDPAEAKALAERYFGRIPRGAKAPPEVVTEEIDQLAERRMAAEAETNPSVQIRWRTTSFEHADRAPLEVLDGILTGRTGRFYKSLVEDKQIATGEPYSYVRAMRFDGMMEIGAELADGVPHQVVEDALLAEIQKLQEEPVTERELQKVKNQNLANSYRRLQSNFFLLIQLLMYDVMGDYNFINESAAQVEAVTADDIMRVAKTYFTEAGRNVMWYDRKAGSEEDPEIAALQGQAKQFAKQVLAQVAQSENPDELAQALAQMQGMAGQAPPEFKPALDLVISRIQERIAELEGGEEE